MNLLVKNYFVKLGFSFGDISPDLKIVSISIKDNVELTDSLKDNIYLYENHNPIQTSFYLITKELDANQLKEVHQYFWNENKYELFFAFENDKTKKDFRLNLYYALTNPRKKQVLISTFYGKDNELIETINKWSFDSGAFWMQYAI